MATAPEVRLARLARTPEDSEALARFDRRMALPLVLSAVLPLFLVPGSSDAFVADAVIIVSWLVFVWDFAEHLRRLKGYLGTWWGRIDLGVVLITAPWFLVVGPSDGKFVMIVRLARLARVLMATAGARRLFERLGRVALVAGIVVFLGAFDGLPGGAPDESRVRDLRRLDLVGDRDAHDRRVRRHRPEDDRRPGGRGHDHAHRHRRGRPARRLARQLLPPRTETDRRGGRARGRVGPADETVPAAAADASDVPRSGPVGTLTAEIDGRLAALEAQVGLLVDQIRRLADRS